PYSAVAIPIRRFRRGCHSRRDPGRARGGIETGRGPSPAPTADRSISPAAVGPPQRLDAPRKSLCPAAILEDARVARARPPRVLGQLSPFPDEDAPRNSVGRAPGCPVPVGEPNGPGAA